MIDVSELIEDPDFAFEYTVLRRTGAWANARFVVSPPEHLLYYGAVQPASTRDIEQLGIGDTEKGVMKFFCRQPKDLYITNNFDQSSKNIQISDEIEFRGLLYKIIQASPWQHGGWIKAFASLKGGAAANDSQENSTRS